MDHPVPDFALFVYQAIRYDSQLFRRAWILSSVCRVVISQIACLSISTSRSVFISHCTRMLYRHVFKYRTGIITCYGARRKHFFVFATWLFYFTSSFWVHFENRPSLVVLSIRLCGTVRRPISFEFEVRQCYLHLLPPDGGHFSISMNIWSFFSF